MRHATVLAALALFSVWTLTISGCWGKSKAPASPAGGITPAAPTEARPQQLQGTSGELQNVAAGWRELKVEMAKEKPDFKVVTAKAWAIAGSADQIMKLAERVSGSPALPAKGASADEIRKLGFATGMGEDKFPEAFRDVELIGINAKNLAAAASKLDTDETRKWWGQLDHLCEGVCGGVAAPAPAPAPAPGPAPAPAPGTAPATGPAPTGKQ